MVTVKLPTSIAKSQMPGHNDDLLFEKLIWLNSNEAAQYLRVSTAALRVMIYRGMIRPHKLGRRNRFKKDDLDRLIESPYSKENRYGH